MAPILRKMMTCTILLSVLLKSVFVAAVVVSAGAERRGGGDSPVL